MNKTILKTALITLGSLVVAGILIFSLWILIAPQSMATVSEKLGNYNFAVTCANLKYKYSDETEDLARCAEDSILSGEDKLIIKYCDPLVKCDNFDELCTKRNEKLADTLYGRYATSYKTYIIGNLAAAQYRLGDLQKAVQTCELGDKECFKRLILEIVQNGTEEDRENVKKYPQQSENREYVEEMIKILTQA